MLEWTEGIGAKPMSLYTLTLRCQCVNQYQEASDAFLLACFSFLRTQYLSDGSITHSFKNNGGTHRHMDIPTYTLNGPNGCLSDLKNTASIFIIAKHVLVSIWVNE